MQTQVTSNVELMELVVHPNSDLIYDRTSPIVLSPLPSQWHCQVCGAFGKRVALSALPLLGIEQFDNRGLMHCDRFKCRMTALASINHFFQTRDFLIFNPTKIDTAVNIYITLADGSMQLVKGQLIFVRNNPNFTNDNPSNNESSLKDTTPNNDTKAESILVGVMHQDDTKIYTGLIELTDLIKLNPDFVERFSKPQLEFIHKFVYQLPFASVNAAAQRWQQILIFLTSVECKE